MKLYPRFHTTLVLGCLMAGLFEAPFVRPAAAQSRRRVAPVRTLYANALGEETAVRKAIAAPKPLPTVLKAVRTAVADFESVVRHYPTSSYCDDALWRAAQLSVDAFGLFKESRDATAAARLFRMLASEYPSSRFARQVPRELAALEASVAATATPAPPPASQLAARAPAGDAAAPPAPAPAPEAATPASPPPDTSTPTTAPSTASASAASEDAAASPAAIKDIRRLLLPDVVRVVIELDREVSFYNERLDGPDRIFVDLSPTRADFNLIDHTLRYDRDSDVVGQIRIGRHPNDVTRVVLDTDGVSSYSVYPLYSPFRLVIDCLREAKAGAAAAQPAPAAPAPAPAATPVSASAAPPSAPVPIPFPAPAAAPSRPSAPPAPTPAPPPTPARAAAAPAATSASSAAGTSTITIDASAGTDRRQVPIPPPMLPSAGAPGGASSLSMARQLGLGISRIVIDPGHGGHDPGAKGPGLTEADLVLDVALRLEKLLTKLENVEVILTRRTNQFIPLEERTAIANREGADLFLSIHANASRSASARGVETYFLDFATTQAAAAVAARENATSGQTMGSIQDVVKAITLNNKLDESRDFAAHVHREMIGTLKGANKDVRDLGVKQAPFVVLIGAAMPSILAEVSFLSNANEAKLLKSAAYRQRIAQALLEGIRKYQQSLKPWQSIAQGQD